MNEENEGEKIAKLIKYFGKNLNERMIDNQNQMKHTNKLEWKRERHSLPSTNLATNMMRTDMNRSKG